CAARPRRSTCAGSATCARAGSTWRRASSIFPAEFRAISGSSLPGPNNRSTRLERHFAPHEADGAEVLARMADELAIARVVERLDPDHPLGNRGMPGVKKCDELALGRRRSENQDFTGIRQQRGETVEIVGVDRSPAGVPQSGLVVAVNMVVGRANLPAFRFVEGERE